MSEQEPRSLVVKHQDAGNRTWAAGFAMNRPLPFGELKLCVEKVVSQQIAGEVELWFDNGAARTPLSSQAELDVITYDQLATKGNSIYVTAKA